MTDAPDDSTTTVDTSADSDSDGDGDTPGGISKRTLIRLLVGFGIGIPILVEGITFLGLLDQQFGGGEDGDAGESTTTETATPGVGVGDDLLPETDRSETLASAVLREVDGDRWPLSLTVEVRNTGDTDYEFQLLSVYLADGRTISGRTSTDRLAPGERRTITGEWSIPAGSTPSAVEVVALVYPESVARNTTGNRTESGDDDDSIETIERRVELAKIPVRGG